MKKNVVIFNGGENFATLIEKGAYYVDKTAYLKELFLGNSEVMNPLFIRPRRFGKTLNLSMIKEFCELNYKNPGDKSYQQKLFVENGRNLAVTGDDYQELREKIMGEFPVISISFKGVEGNSFEAAVSSLLEVIAELYKRFLFLKESTKQLATDKKVLQNIYDFCMMQKDRLFIADNLKEAVSICGTFIATLAIMLHREYEKSVIVIIDEYDVPLQKAVVAKEPYYEEMLEIVKKISITTFKQSPDPWLYKGIVSGCLRIAHQSVFTDANNFTIYGLDDKIYRGFFGFTKDETKKMLADCGILDKEDEVKEWYDGYRFCKLEIFCPWSVSSYCYNALSNESFKPKPYWVNTSGNDIITLFAQNSIESCNVGNISQLQSLLNGESVEITLQEFDTYPDLRKKTDFASFMTMMLHTGYVTFADDSDFNEKVKVKIPNYEVRKCFEKKFEYLYGAANPLWMNKALELLALLMENKTDEAQSLIGIMLKEFISIRNTGNELYYHGFLLGVLGLAASTRGIEIFEEQESGSGFSDLILDSFQDKTACILELKRTNILDDCYDAATQATKQIVAQNYATKYILKRYKRVYGIGIGFAKKDCEIVSLGNLVQDHLI